MLRLTRYLHRDSGSTIVPVIGMVAVAGILTALIASVSVHALSYTSMTRAGVQAQAAADAGLEFMRAQLATGSCPAGNSITRTYGQVYSGAGGELERQKLGIDAAQTYFDVSVERPNLVTGAWEPGCPLLGLLLDSRVRITSTGYASAPGIAGATARDSHTVEAVHKWSLGTAEPPMGGGSAIYVGGGSAGIQNPVTVYGNGSDVHILDGNFTCHSGGHFEGDVYVANGDATLHNPCEITGTLHVEGNVVANAGTDIGGDLIARGSVTTYNNKITVGGDVRAHGLSSFSAEVGGSVYSSSLNDASFNGNDGGLKIHGDLQVAGSLDTWGHSGYPGLLKNAKIKNFFESTGRVEGRVSYLAVLTPRPSAPSVPGWVDVTYQPADWPGFTKVDWQGGCQVDSASHGTYSTIVNSTVNLVIDAMSCDRVTLNNLDLVVKADVVILNRAMTLGGAAIRSGDGAAHKVWLITPDDAPGTAGPQCDRPWNDSLDNWSNTVVHAEITAFAYTPCKIVFNQVDWRGQLYSGSITFNSGGTLTYAPIGIPGVDLGEGSSGGGTLPPITSLGELESYRSVAG